MRASAHSADATTMTWEVEEADDAMSVDGEEHPLQPRSAARPWLPQQRLARLPPLTLADLVALGKEGKGFSS